MPYYCQVGAHLYVTGDSDGCEHPKCLEFREVEVVASGPFFGAVPGGTRAGAAAKKISKLWHDDMYAYENARKNGLEPDQVNVKASSAVMEQAEREAS